MDKPLESFLDAQGRLSRWPRKKVEKLLVLRYLSSKFAEGRVYGEPEVNAVIMALHTFGDHALLRRELYDNFLLHRTPDGRSYWAGGANKPGGPAS